MSKEVYKNMYSCVLKCVLLSLAVLNFSGCNKSDEYKVVADIEKEMMKNGTSKQAKATAAAPVESKQELKSLTIAESLKVNCTLQAQINCSYFYKDTQDLVKAFFSSTSHMEAYFKILGERFGITDIDRKKGLGTFFFTFFHGSHRSAYFMIDASGKEFKYKSFVDEGYDEFQKEMKPSTRVANKFTRYLFGSMKLYYKPLSELMSEGYEISGLLMGKSEHIHHIVLKNTKKPDLDKLMIVNLKTKEVSTTLDF